MIISFLRTIILYLLVIAAIRLMGKRQIGELQPSELVVAIMISDLASVPMSDIAIPLSNGIIPILTLIIAEVLLSFLSLKSETVRNLLTGKPSIVIRNGVIDQKEMRKSRYNLEDLMEELRLKDYIALSDIFMAILETNGELTVIPKSDKRPLKAEDFQIRTPQETLPHVIISDGKLRKEHLKEAGKDENWVKKQIAHHGASDIRQVFIMTVDNEQNIFVQLKNKGEKP
ncbi:MAG: DUF421 domain-containing protein [Ruminococcaceae bacterium]|nr:DUF421 domain-containing protein [Oscillospiraceae bacterium]